MVIDKGTSASPPSQVFGTEKFNGVCTYNGLDRADNSKGYVIDNVVACCFSCNRAKGASTLEEFKSWATRLYKHFIKNGG